MLLLLHLLTLILCVFVCVGGDNNFIAFYFKIDPKKIALISMWQVGQFAGNADMYSD